MKIQLGKPVQVITPQTHYIGYTQKYNPKSDTYDVIVVFNFRTGGVGSIKRIKADLINKIPDATLDLREPNKREYKEYNL